MRVWVRLPFPKRTCPPVTGRPLLKQYGIDLRMVIIIIIPVVLLAPRPLPQPKPTTPTTRYYLAMDAVTTTTVAYLTFTPTNAAGCATTAIPIRDAYGTTR